MPSLSGAPVPSLYFGVLLQPAEGTQVLPVLVIFQSVPSLFCASHSVPASSGSKARPLASWLKVAASSETVTVGEPGHGCVASPGQSLVAPIVTDEFVLKAPTPSAQRPRLGLGA